jgi:hypothetical protein
LIGHWSYLFASVRNDGHICFEVKFELLKSYLKMKKENYTEMSKEELQKKLSTSRLLTGMLAGALLTLLLLNIFVTKKNFWGIIAVPLCLSPILVLNYNVIIQRRASQ